MPLVGCLVLAVVGPTAGRYLIDLTCGVPPKQFVRGEWFVGTAVLTGGVWLGLEAAGVPVRHIEQGVNVPMYRTTVPCRPAGRFSGPMVVSMRPLTPPQTVRATQICSRLPRAHGAPVHFGDPAAIGIWDITKPDFGDPVTIKSGEQPVFWACGVTPQAVLMQARPPFAITHKPGHMFLTDLKDSDLECD